MSPLGQEHHRRPIWETQVEWDKIADARPVAVLFNKFVIKVYTYCILVNKKVGNQAALS